MRRWFDTCEREYWEILAFAFIALKFEVCAYWDDFAGKVKNDDFLPKKVVLEYQPVKCENMCSPKC